MDENKTMKPNIGTMISKVCRTCLYDGDSEMGSVLEAIQCEGKSLRICDMIMKYCQVEILPEDMFSKHICSKCIQDAKNAYLFKLRCEYSQNVLIEFKANYMIEMVDRSIKEEFKESFDDRNMSDNSEELPIHSDTEIKLEDVSNAPIKKQDVTEVECPVVCKKLQNTQTKNMKKRTKSKWEGIGVLNVNFVSQNKEKSISYLSCGSCKYKTKSQAMLKKHLQSHRSKTVYKCGTCNYSTENSINFKSHQLEHGIIKPFKCADCDSVFSDLSNLRRHLLTHNNYKPFACEFCAYRTGRLESIREHTRRHTGAKPFLCDQCDYRCSTKSSLRTHLRNKHSEEKKFACNDCSFKTKARSALVVHIKTHGPEKRFSCDVCSYKSHTLVGLQNHTMSAHTGERPFTCDKCPYSAVTSGSLKIHKRIHSGFKNFTCTICNCSFYLKSRLENHIRIHTGVKPYNCKLCEFKSASSSSLRRHERKIHNIITANKLNENYLYFSFFLSV